MEEATQRSIESREPGHTPSKARRPIYSTLPSKFPGNSNAGPLVSLSPKPIKILKSPPPDSSAPPMNSTARGETKKLPELSAISRGNASSFNKQFLTLL